MQVVYNRLVVKKAILVIILVALASFYVVKQQNTSDQNNQPDIPGQVIKRGSQFNKTAYSTSDPASIWVVVNKSHPLNPVSFTPADLVTPNLLLRSGSSEMKLRKASADALKTMADAAKKSGVSLMLASGYRSYALQSSVYNSYVRSSGQAAADRESARPGYSEHQTGLAADLEATDRVCEVQQCFGDTATGEWLSSNAYKYGFIIRYPDGYESITGYKSEPWHVRYVGVELAAKMHSDNVKALEQFFGISGGTQYKPAT